MTNDNLNLLNNYRGIKEMPQKTIEAYLNRLDEISGEIADIKKDPIFDQLSNLADQEAKLKIELNEAVFKIASKDLKDKEYGCGTVNFEEAGYKFKAVVSKKVKWNEKMLRGIAEKIRSVGRDPEEFIQYKLNVLETAYKGFPDAIQKEFEPARTVEPSKPVITIERV